MRDRIDKKSPVSKRLKYLRIKLGYAKPGQFAKELGISPARWSNVENGYPVSRELAFLIKRRTGVDLDWIYFGETFGLEYAMRQLLADGVAKPGHHSIMS